MTVLVGLVSGTVGARPLLAQEPPGADSLQAARRTEAIARADSVRASLVRPEPRPRSGLPGGVAGVLAVVRAPLDLLGRGALAGFSAVDPALRDVQGWMATWHAYPELTSIGPRSGPSAELRLQPGPVWARAAYSIRRSRRFGIGVDLGARSLRDRPAPVTASLEYSLHAEPFFWGIGPESSAEDRSAYRWERWVGGVTTLVGRTTPLRLHGTVAYEDNRVDRAGVAGTPDLQDVFASDLPFGAAERLEFLRVEAGVEWDRRHWLLVQQRGWRVAASAALFQGVSGTDESFYRLATSLDGYLPITRRHAFALRLALEANRQITGEDIPFTHLAALGSTRGLRGFTRDRFRDRDAAVLMAEYRYEIWRDEALGLGAEGVLFGDLGAVERNLVDIDGSDLRSAFGFGIRVVRDHRLQMFTYLGFSEEETRLALRFDWPF